MAVLRAVLLTTGAGLFVLLAAAAILPSLEGAPLMAFRAAALAGLAGAVILGAAHYFKRRETLEGAALAVEKEHPWLKNALINSLQLFRASGKPGPAGAFSRILLSKYLEQVAGLLDKIDIAKVAPRAQLRRPAVFAAASAILLAGFMALAPGRAGRGLHSMFLDPWTMPVGADQREALPLTTGDFTISYSFPAYSGIESQTVEHTNGDIAALKGTGIVLETSVLEPLKSAALITSGGARYAMRVERGVDLRAELVLAEPGTYYIEGEAKDGSRRAEPRSHRMVVDEDLPPTAVMLTPVGDVEVAAEGSLDVDFEAEDDFGIRRIELVYELEGEQERLLIRSVKGDGNKRIKESYEWLISEHDFAPGARIPFFIEVIDNDEVAGGKAGRSETRVLEIFSARKFHRELLTRQDELLDKMIDHLGLHVVAGLDLQEGKAKVRESEEKLLLDAREMIAQANALLADLLEDEFKDELVVETLEDISRRYPEMLAERARAIEGEGPIEGRALESLLSLRDEFQFNLENDIIYLDRLIKKQRVEDLLAEADDLYKAQADLADLLAEYKSTGDPALLEQLRQAMAELQSAFQDLMRRMAEMRKSLPEEFLNTDGMDKNNMVDLAQKMEKLRQALADGDLENAAAMAEEFLAMMGQWMAGLEEGAGQFGDMLSKETMRKLDDISERLEDLIKRQQVIEDAIRDIYEDALKNASDTGEFDQMMESLNQRIAEFQEDVSQTQKSFFQLMPGAMDGKPRPVTGQVNRERYDAASPLYQIRRDAGNVKASIEDRDLGRAIEQAEQLKEKLDQSLERTDGYAEQYRAGPPERRAQYQENADRTRESLDGLISELNDLKERLSMSLDPSQMAELEDLSRLQEEARSDTQGLMDSYEEVRAEAPSLPGEVSDHLGKASSKMYDASGEMVMGEPGRAMAPAREARGHLEQAGQELGKAKRQMQQGMGMGMGMSGGMHSSNRDGNKGPSSDGEVKLPDEDAYSVPEEFREEILKAMKEESPDAYKYLNRDYYERLVR